MDRIILHSDLNAFYASVACLYHPELRGKPVAVCGSVEQRHGIILASTPEAKACNVKTGDAAWQARQKCPNLILVEPHMEQYVLFSTRAREIYADYSPAVEPFGLDESWIDLTGSGTFADAIHTADIIRERIRRELGLTVSIGVSFNKSMAKIGSDLRKPDYTNPIPREGLQEIVWPLPAQDLWGVGRATRGKLARYGIDTIGRLAQTDPEQLRRLFGVNGYTLWQLANGMDQEPVAKTGSARVVKSIGNSTTTPRDLVTEQDIRVTAMLLAESVAERMREQQFKCQTVQVGIRRANLASCERQERLPFPSCTARRIGDAATRLILANWTGDPIRSLGVRGCNLVCDAFPQMSLLAELQQEQKQEDLERTVQNIRHRFGHFSIRRGSMLPEQTLTNLDIRDKASAQSIAFFRR
ncbi:MAG: DNA polymerase IV [Oscillospiraceae bacterium]|nr:DNA polymerase IV [Oscillospiraceae bacterium]